MTEHLPPDQREFKWWMLDEGLNRLASGTVTARQVGGQFLRVSDSGKAFALRDGRVVGVCYMATDGQPIYGHLLGVIIQLGPVDVVAGNRITMNWDDGLFAVGQ